MDRNANRNAARNHNDAAVCHSRTGGGHTHRPGRRREARRLNKRGRRADAAFQIANS